MAKSNILLAFSCIVAIYPEHMMIMTVIQCDMMYCEMMVLAYFNGEYGCNDANWNYCVILLLIELDSTMVK